MATLAVPELTTLECVCVRVCVRESVCERECMWECECVWESVCVRECVCHFMLKYPDFKFFQNQGTKCVGLGTEWFSKYGDQNVYLPNDFQNLGFKMYTYQMIFKIRESKCIHKEWFSKSSD